ncbi:hypothetical protein MRB53_031155 [Persea americana]|uniref:Uncharacterized protein n=1 Tax=Persea americana TaxID=3435 RepID=A0ACC2KP44_PERAE|nr:hypothetical protein MRB53_031155 [Persea americana]|eukprot:TRINITY_DN25152_c0_g1_i1.p1 TRINITY_DN25152_c0_g1~~TRINITY_DN25152_c0_g1_i1.p1  ORF type:complete len:324 (-),score=70.03 TRINITY_DN25152_c0_g1_i1:457-1428(-)
MEANALGFVLTPPLSHPPSARTRAFPRPSKPALPPRAVVTKTKAKTKKNEKAELDEYGIPKEYDPSFGLPKEVWDEEWQAQRREETKEMERRQRLEDEEENRKVAEYRQIGTRLKDYPEEEVRKARRLVSSFIKSAEEVEEKIEAAADRGELTELVLMVIWNRLDLARRDDEKDAIRSLDLLYRRVEMEILKREATPAMRLLNDLLNLHEGFDDEWLKKCRKRLIDSFPREDPFSILVPEGFDINAHQGRIGLPQEAEDVLLRVDFVREVDELLQEVRAEQSGAQMVQSRDPESIAVRMKHEEKQRTIRQVEALLDLAMTLEW